MAGSWSGHIIFYLYNLVCGLGSIASGVMKQKIERANGLCDDQSKRASGFSRIVSTMHQECEVW